MTSLLKLQAVSRCQAQLIELYEAKVAILGTITSDTAEILIARPGASVFKAVDPTSLDFVNTTGRRKDENKANYVQGLKLAKEATASDWEQTTMVNLDMVTRSCELSTTPSADVVNPTGNRIDRLKAIDTRIDAMRQELAMLLGSTDSTAISHDTLHRGYMGSRTLSPATGDTEEEQLVRSLGGAAVDDDDSRPPTRN